MLNTTITIALLGIFFFLFCTPSIASTANRLISRLQLPSPLTGPESLAFDRDGGGPYTGVSDGRILKYDRTSNAEGFSEFAFTSRNRNKTICDGIADFSALQATCGRPLGVGFNYQTGELYIADAYLGLVKVPFNGGPASAVVTAAQGNPFRFLNGLDIDPATGIVYFTEASSRFQIRDMQTLLSRRDDTGSLFRYDPSTKQTSVLLTDLALASGVAVSQDGSFVLVSEYMANRIQRFWLSGVRANTSEIFRRFSGRPDKIRRNSRGEFWVAVNAPLGPPAPPRPVLPLAVRIAENGLVLQVMSLADGYGPEAVSEVQEFNGILYSGSLSVSYAGIFRP